MNNSQKCLNKLCDELLGKDYYIVDPVGGNQANEIITDRIIELYKKKTIKVNYKWTAIVLMYIVATIFHIANQMKR